MLTVWFSFTIRPSHADLPVNTRALEHDKSTVHLLLFILCHTMEMEFPDPCPDGPMRPNSIHLACVTSLIISTQLHPMSKAKGGGLNSTELNIKDSLEDEKLRSWSYKHFLVRGILFHLSPCIPHLPHQLLLRVLPRMDLPWEMQHPC